MLIYNERFKLRESDFDEFDNLKPSAFLDFFQSVASTHATLKGMGFDDMIKKNIAWVLTKVKLDAYKRVKAKDTIIVETIPRPKGLIDYTRDYYIYDEENAGGNELLREMPHALAISPEDVLDSLHIQREVVEKEPVQLSMTESQILDCLHDGEKHFEELLADTSLNVADLTNLLFNLEIDGLIVKSAGNYYALA